MSTAISEPLVPSRGEARELEQNLVTNLVAAFVDEPKFGRRKGKGAAARRTKFRTLKKKLLEPGSDRILKVQKALRHYRMAKGDYAIVRVDKPGKSVSAGIEGAVRRAVEGTIGDAGAMLALIDPTVLRIANVVSHSLPDARGQASVATIEKLVDALIQTQDPVAPVSAEIDVANAEARVRFMRDIVTLTAEQVTLAAGSTARNRSQTASRWKAEGKIFSISWQGSERYPAFQFRDGRPIAVMAEVLRMLPDAMSPWEIAFWFVSTNGWLDDAAPYERLGEGERVITAARREGEDVLG